MPYGATKSEAARAFARATRRLRKTADAPYDLEDVNWALHAVEQRIEDPSASIDDYRVPADNGAYDAPPGHGLFDPPVEPYPRRTGPVTAEDRQQIEAVILREVVQNLVDDAARDALPRLHKFIGEEA
ncbi:hypothetical protein Q6350_03605 [Isoptericola sp. b515]|uniref:hypothetical protein n=1 Tax=Isoptericola sp. b515 TaxID=3064652 RepID=UPI002713DC1C|nr:hypothetical protein [Isoptericola sp. b515]MDO8147509.1 hypothetical protein [Isoptericola sp. b515]